MRLPTPSTITMVFLGKTRVTLPLLPLSTPEIMTTVSPFLMWREVIQLYDFRRTGDNRLVAELLQLARYRAEDAPRLALAHDHADENVLLFDRLARLGGLHREHHQLAYLGVALFGAAGYLENASDFGAGVVCNLYE